MHLLQQNNTTNNSLFHMIMHNTVKLMTKSPKMQKEKLQLTTLQPAALPATFAFIKSYNPFLILCMTAISPTTAIQYFPIRS